MFQSLCTAIQIQSVDLYVLLEQSKYDFLIATSAESDKNRLGLKADVADFNILAKFPVIIITVRNCMAKNCMS